MKPDINPSSDGDPEPAATGPARGGARIRQFALVALTVVLIGLCVLLAVPFLPSITWAAALAILAWPMHRWIRRQVPWPGLAAGISTVVVVTVILGTGVFVTYQLANEARSAVQQVQRESAEGGGLRERAAEIPALGRAVAWMERVGVDIQTEARRFIGSLSRELSRLTQGSAAAAIQFLVAVFILYYLFREPWAFLHELRELLPLSRSESDFLLTRAADSVHANLHATLVTGLINAGSFGLWFWALGLPAPLLWTVVMFVLSILPIVGAGLVWVPAAAYLAFTGRWLAAAALVGWGVLTFIAVGYFLYGRLVGERMRMHDVPALLAFLGGLAVFGLSGMILGPAILAVTMALLEVWKRRLAGVGGDQAVPDIAGVSE